MSIGRCQMQDVSFGEGKGQPRCASYINSALCNSAVKLSYCICRQCIFSPYLHLIWNVYLLYFYCFYNYCGDTFSALGHKGRCRPYALLEKICTPWAIEPVQHLLHRITLPRADYHHHEHSQHPIYIFLLWNIVGGSGGHQAGGPEPDPAPREAELGRVAGNSLRSPGYVADSHDRYIDI